MIGLKACGWHDAAKFKLWVREQGGAERICGWQLRWDLEGFLKQHIARQQCLAMC